VNQVRLNSVCGVLSCGALATARPEIKWAVLSVIAGGQVSPLGALPILDVLEITGFAGGTDDRPIGTIVHRMNAHYSNTNALGNRKSIEKIDARHNQIISPANSVPAEDEPLTCLTSTA
jgi:hypothetical protein